MPELPEVRICADLINNFKGETFEKVYKSEVSKVKAIPEFTDFKIEAGARGKELMIAITDKDGSHKIIMGLGMSGVFHEMSSPGKHDHLIFKVKGKEQYICLQDVRRFAKWKIASNYSSDRGPDPMNEFDAFREKIVNNIEKESIFKDRHIHEVMLSQKYFNGIGNYLRSTILYHTDIYPFQTLHALYVNSKQDFERLLGLCKTTCEISYMLGGGQLKDWKNPNGIDPTEFKKFVYYGKGSNKYDMFKRRFWYNPKWDKLRVVTTEDHDDLPQGSGIIVSEIIEGKVKGLWSSSVGSYNVTVDYDKVKFLQNV